MTAFPRCPECNGQRVPMNYVGDVVGAVCYCGFARRAEPSTSFEDVYRTQTAEITRLRAEVEALKSLSERLKLEAQIHAQEARTANATIAECYQAVAGGKGEPGNWHGAQPVRDCIEALRADAERADAERYRHLKAHHVREYPDDNGTLCIEFWCDFDNWDDIDAAIDAARAAQGERG